MSQSHAGDRRGELIVCSHRCHRRHMLASAHWPRRRFHPAEQARAGLRQVSSPVATAPRRVPDRNAEAGWATATLVFAGCSGCSHSIFRQPAAVVPASVSPSRIAFHLSDVRGLRQAMARAGVRRVPVHSLSLTRWTWGVHQFGSNALARRCRSLIRSRPLGVRVPMPTAAEVAVAVRSLRSSASSLHHRRDLVGSIHDDHELHHDAGPLVILCAYRRVVQLSPQAHHQRYPEPPGV